ncbi:MAG: hypothetical protein ACXIU5_09540 [Halomonadaceae bacterium]|jgi:hypothetical protein|uniref:hypothetical protein n=1 Tax=Halomonas sp. MCCC 1A11062 TaxID=2733485 RepID=UPI001F360057|nr:hypothetical protein [Halomonas sp. MCCC 1A11062]MCE8037401.1 hypothetical protein [Halomonas sp. MCCC 1A11062]
MKHNAISTAVMTVMLALGMVGNASAMPSYGPFNLVEGNTSSKLLSGVDHYRLQVNGTSNVTIQSHGMNTGGGNHSGMTAVLRDGNGNVVTQTGSNSGDFIISQQLSPGNYTLEVHANMLRGGTDSTNFYHLTTVME